MKKLVVAFVITVLQLSLAANAQSTPENTSASTPAFSTWSVHSPDVVIAGRTVYPLGVLTPAGAIVVRRLEALSNNGPVKGRLLNGQLIPCPVQYSLELSNGVTRQEIPISNTFISKDSSQTYTDSGPLALIFAPNARITLTLLPPPRQYPAVNCSLEGLNITIQYTEADGPAAGASTDNP
jgi:hypothetical protein